MKKRKIWLMIVTLAAAISMLSGCGKAGGEAMQETNSLNENGDNENTPQNEDAEEEKDSNTETKNADLNDTKAENGEPDGGEPEEESFSENSEELEGMVQSIGEGSVVISRIFSEKSEEDGLYYVSGVAEGSDEEELVTVSVTEDTKFQVRTIKNGGEDVTEREGTFEDMKKDMIVNVTGYMDNAGEEIRASEIVIMEVISQ
ncbi:MAG: hypothetical protein HFI95_07930 [Lachnospiraceae bacterium]|nr:hypothetical protein [Lachnospiraceae bacterium]